MILDQQAQCVTTENNTCINYVIIAMICCCLKAMILNNHGLAALGSTVDEAFFVLRLLVVACDFQVLTIYICVLHNMLFCV